MSDKKKAEQRKAREWWLANGTIFTSPENADRSVIRHSQGRVVHVREVMPGEEDALLHLSSVISDKDDQLADLRAEVERLQEKLQVQHQYNGEWEEEYQTLEKKRDETIDQNRRLIRENETLSRLHKEKHDAWQTAFNDACRLDRLKQQTEQERDELREQLQEADRSVVEWKELCRRAELLRDERTDECNRRMERIEQLEEALRPFSDMNNWFDRSSELNGERNPDREWLGHGNETRQWVEQARKALEGK